MRVFYCVVYVSAFMIKACTSAFCAPLELKLN